MSWKDFEKKGAAAAVSQEDRIRNLGLLVVDDEQEIVDALREVFAKHFDIHHATSASAALDAFRAQGPKIVITDQRMPEMTGLELLRQIKDIDPSTVRILITGYSDLHTVVQALNEGLVWQYVAKPWNHEELRALVLRGARRHLEETGGVRGQYRGLLGM
jgi:DNA-binding NtrC family response regulator